jgi:ABC-type transport system involved in cytochrome c biogenesis permease component
MTFLPVVERELRVASRRGGTYLNRFLAALIGLLVFGFTFLNASRQSPREIGQTLFYSLSGIFLGVALLSGIRYTADCLSEEKREGTLGLLFLTDLKGYDVVLGKLAATSINAFYGLVAIVPVLAIPLLIGGVSFAEFGRMVLVLTDSLVFSLATGLFVSAVSRNARKAMAGTFLLILLIHAGLPAAGAWLALRYPTPGPPVVHKVFLTPSAGFAYARALDRGFQPAPFLWSVGLIHGLSWAFLILASLSVRYSWQDKVVATDRTGWRRRLRQALYGSEEKARALRRRLLDINPCLWLGSRQRWKPVLVWSFLLLGGAGWLVGYIKLKDDWLNEAVCITVAFAAHLVFKLWVASEACLRFGPDRRSGALELVLSTPLPVKELVRGQMLALRRQFFWPVCTVLGVDLLLLIGILRSEPNRVWFFWLGAVGITTFLVDLYALAWTGMWIGLVARHPNRAAGATATRILVLFWLGYTAVLFLVETLEVRDRVLMSEYSYLGLYFALGMAIDAAVLLWARFRLERDLRSVVTQRFERRGPFLGWPWFGKRKPAAGPAPLAPTAP